LLEALDTGLAFRWNMKESEFMGAKDLRIEVLDYGCYGRAVNPMPDHINRKRHRKELGADGFGHERNLLVSQNMTHAAQL
jgi:hypothetical protein